LDHTDGRDIFRLASVAEDDIQYEQISRLGTETVKSDVNNLSDKREELVLEQQAPFQNAADKVKFVGCVR
jgi:hypothetical protein